MPLHSLYSEQKSELGTYLLLTATYIDLFFYLSPVLLIFQLHYKLIKTDQASYLHIIFRAFYAAGTVGGYLGKVFFSQKERSNNLALHVLMMNVIFCASNIAFVIYIFYRKYNSQRQFKAFCVAILIWFPLEITAAFLFVKKYISDNRDLVEVVADIFLYVCTPFKLWTPGTNTLKLFKSKKKLYISYPIASISLVYSISWILSDVCEFLEGRKSRSIGFITADFIADVIAALLSLTQILLFNKYDGCESDNVLEESDDLKRGRNDGIDEQKQFSPDDTYI